MMPQQPPPQQPYGYGPPPPGYGPPPTPQQQKNSNATLAMWLGLASFVTCGFAGIPALILGLKAKKQIDAEPQRYANAGQAIAGIVMGAFGCLIVVFAMLGMALPSRDKSAGHAATSASAASTAPATTTTMAAATAPIAAPALPSAVPSTAANAQAAASLPASEQAFCKVVGDFAKQYDDAKSEGANELKLSKLRTARKQAMMQAVRSTVSGWIGEIADLSTNSEGKAAVKVRLPCEGGTVMTWNNGLSDIEDNTLIPQSSKLFDVLSDVGEGKTVSFGGTFVLDSKDGFKEASMTEEGSLSDPEYIFKFTQVKAVN